MSGRWTFFREGVLVLLNNAGPHTAISGLQKAAVMRAR